MMTAVTTAKMLTIIGAQNHHITPRLSQTRCDKTFDSTAAAVRIAMAG